MASENSSGFLLACIKFSAEQHRSQRRKDKFTPYINHPIEVAELIWRIGKIDDVIVLGAAILHDTIEDTTTTSKDLTFLFGETVSQLVSEVTDDKSLPYMERKRIQIERAPSLSNAAKVIRLADKICNVRDMVRFPPADWNVWRRLEYLDWTEQVIAGVRAINLPLENLYDEVLSEGRSALKS